MTQLKQLVSLGSSEILTSPEGYNQLQTFYENCQTVGNGSNIYLDFKNVKSMNGNMCALLTAMLYRLKNEKDLTFFVDEENMKYIKSHLKPLVKNGFLHSDDTSDSDLTNVSLEAFEPNDEKGFVDYIEHELFENIRMKIDPDLKDKMVDKFLEMYSNVQLHARTEFPVFGCGQYLKHEKKLHFTLVDLGVGYLLPIEEHTKGEISTSESAILWALEGNTTKPDAPGGTGLIDLLKYCEDTSSHLNIITGDTYWGNNLPLGKTLKIRPFRGTILHMIFNCS